MALKGSRCAVCMCAPRERCDCVCHEGRRFGEDEKGRRYDTKTGVVR